MTLIMRGVISGPWTSSKWGGCFPSIDDLLHGTGVVNGESLL